MTRFATLSCIIVTLFAASVVSAAEPQGKVKFERHDGSVDVSIDGKPFTTYHFDVKGDPQFVRPYMYPVLAPDGTPITSDQLLAHRANPKADHPHHRSFYVAHGDVDGADHWSLEKKDKQPHQNHVDFEKLDGDTIVEVLKWESKDRGPTLLNEKRTIRFFMFDDGARGVDLTVALTPAGANPVTLHDTKEAGLCAVRVAKSISDKPTLTNSAGQGGEGKAGEEATWGKAAAWCDLSGEINGKPYGVTILDHPSNPRAPTRWHARAYGLLTANPWGLHEYDKSPAGTGDQKLEPGKATTFRYRVVFHEGDAKSAKLDEKMKAFAGE